MMFCITRVTFRLEEVQNDLHKHSMESPDFFNFAVCGFWFTTKRQGMLAFDVLKTLVYANRFCY
jgi:hypothetical protein